MCLLMPIRRQIKDLVLLKQDMFNKDPGSKLIYLSHWDATFQTDNDINVPEFSPFKIAE